MIRLAAALALSTSLLAAEKGIPRIVGVEPLMPSADSAITLERVVLEELSDGTRRIRATVRPETQSRSGGVFYRYDLKAKTYRAISIDDPNASAYGIPSKLIEQASQFRKNVATLEPDQPTAFGDGEPPPNCGAPDGPQPCDYPCSGTLNGILGTYDPVFIKVAETRGMLRYRYGGANGCHWSANAFPTCWANPNTGLSTWFTSSCNGGGYGLTTGSADGYANGSYYNYDFGLNSQITRASHRINLIYRYPSYWYEWIHEVSGESWWLLDGTFNWYETGGCYL